MAKSFVAQKAAAILMGAIAVTSFTYIDAATASDYGYYNKAERKFGPISAKDTLWNISNKVRPDNEVTIYQVMQALFDANPKAFSDGNRNHLVEGAYLNIPSKAQMLKAEPTNAPSTSKKATTKPKQQGPVIKKTLKSSNTTTTKVTNTPAAKKSVKLPAY